MDSSAADSRACSPNFEVCAFSGRILEGGFDLKAGKFHPLCIGGRRKTARPKPGRVPSLAPPPTPCAGGGALPLWHR